MTKLKEGIVLFSALLVVVSIVIDFYAVAYLNYGHPPGSGIVVLIVFICISPFVFISTLLGFHMQLTDTRYRIKPLPQAQQAESSSRTKHLVGAPFLFTCHGINVLYAFIGVCVIFFKVILGQSL